MMVRYQDYLNESDQRKSGTVSYVLTGGIKGFVEKHEPFTEELLDL